MGTTMLTPRINKHRGTKAGWILLALIGVAFVGLLYNAQAIAADDGPVPLLKTGEPVDWWFMFKLNSAVFPGCGSGEGRVCLFGGTPQHYTRFGQQFVYASSADHTLQKGSGCAGDSVNDPLGATFDEVYNGAFYYVLWNDQFYDDPKISGCSKSCGGPWGHSKGLLAWDDKGEGLVLQVTTPSWPAAGSAHHPRAIDGNTLGCVEDNDVMVSQHFFALKLTKDDLIKVLHALSNASVVTDIAQAQIVNNGGPAEISSLVAALGTKSNSKTATKETLSSGIVLVSKPSQLNVPPWQMVSAVLDGVSLRTATWWASPQIYSTKDSTKITCWSSSLGKPGAVTIATTGTWDGHRFNLTGGGAPDHNHAKIGVSISGGAHYTIFGDMNQQGTATGGRPCSSSQNGRGGLFYVIDDGALEASVASLIAGDTAPTHAPAASTRSAR